MSNRLTIVGTVIAFSCCIHNQDAFGQREVSDYLEVHEGKLPIILEAPHGGWEDIPFIRPIPNLGGIDKFTLELTRLIRQRMIERTGKSPEVVALLANRKFIDTNRPAGPKAYSHPFTNRLYEAHYRQIDAAMKRVKNRHGTGLMVLIHSGFNYPVQIDIGVNHTAKLCTIPRYVSRYGWDDFHGPNGLGARLFERGYEVPGFGGTPPRSGPAGIPIITRCRRRNHIGIDGLELEFQGRTLLVDARKREKLAVDVADVLLDFVNQKYIKIPLTKDSKSSEVATNPLLRHRVWTSSDPKRILTIKNVTGNAFQARFQLGRNLGIDRVITGTTDGKSLEWKARDVKGVGGTGGDNFGKIIEDEKGFRIDFEWKSSNGSGGNFTLRATQ